MIYRPGEGLDLESVTRLRERKECFSLRYESQQASLQLGNGIKELIRCESCTFPLSDECLQAGRSFCFRKECLDLAARAAEEVQKKLEQTSLEKELLRALQAKLQTDRCFMKQFVKINSPALDVHVHKAVAVLHKLQTSQRPATREKLASFLQRRKCCEYAFSVPPGRLAKSIEHVLESLEGPMEIRKLFSAFNAATSGMPRHIVEDVCGELTIMDRVQQQVARLKRQTSAVTKMSLTEAGECEALVREYMALINQLTGHVQQFDAAFIQPLANHCVRKLSKYDFSDVIGKPLSSMTDWLCKNAVMEVRTEPGLLVDAIEKYSCFSVDSSDSRRITYDEDVIGRFDQVDTCISGVCSHSLSAREWTSQVMSHEASANAWLDYLDGRAPIACYCPCITSHFPRRELEQLRLLVECGLDLDRNNNMVKISMPSNTLLPKRSISTIVRCVLGREPPLVCPGWFESDDIGLIVGEGRRNLRCLEECYLLRLSVQQLPECRSGLIAWFSTDYFGNCSLPLESCAEAAYIQSEADKLSEQVSKELLLKGLPIKGIASSTFSLALNDVLCSQYMVPRIQRLLSELLANLRKLLRCGLELDLNRRVVIVKMLNDTPFSYGSVMEVVSLVLDRPCIVELRCENIDLYIEYCLLTIQCVHQVRVHIEHIDDDGDVHVFCWMDPTRFTSQAPIEDLTKKWIETSLHIQGEIDALSSKKHVELHEAMLACPFASASYFIKLSRDENKYARRQQASQRSVHNKQQRKVDLQRTAHNKHQRTTKRARGPKEKGRVKNTDKGLPLHSGLRRANTRRTVGSDGCSDDA